MFEFLQPKDMDLLRAIDAGQVTRTPWTPNMLNGREVDRHRLGWLQERGLVVLEHARPPQLTELGREVLSGPAADS